MLGVSLAGPTTVRSPVVVVDDFLSPTTAEAMRRGVEGHFNSPALHAPETHMVWNYWYVPGLYCYLRTFPETIIGHELTSVFYNQLASWSKDTLGFARITRPYLSLYVAGCRQGQHNDAANGRFAFVYSLTKDCRKTSGGETIIWREQDYFGSSLHRATAGEGFYDLIEPRFNRLVVFDDRMPHGVQIVEGGMDPSEGRVVLHGHMYEDGPIVEGPLSQQIVEELATAMVAEYSAELGEALMVFHGPAVLRLVVQPDGIVSGLRVVLDRVARLTGEGPTASEVIGEITVRASRLRFPREAEASLITLPIGFGNRLAELR